MFFHVHTHCQRQRSGSHDQTPTDRINLTRLYPLKLRRIIVRLVSRAGQGGSNGPMLKSTDKLRCHD